VGLCSGGVESHLGTAVVTAEVMCLLAPLERVVLGVKTEVADELASPVIDAVDGHLGTCDLA